MQSIERNEMNLKAIYPGTFDPVTNGHIDIIKRASHIFEHVIVAVATNRTKNPFFPIDLRIHMLEESLKMEKITGVKVVGFDNLLIDFVQEQGARVILRGLRAISDFEYEFQLAGMNRKLFREIETVFLTPSEHFMFISSSLVREIASLHGDVSQFVPAVVVDALEKRRREKNV